jgi:hypothetical protein
VLNLLDECSISLLSGKTITLKFHVFVSLIELLILLTKDKRKVTTMKEEKDLSNELSNSMYLSHLSLAVLLCIFFLLSQVVFLVEMAGQTSPFSIMISAKN